MLPAALWPLPVRAPRSRLAHGPEPGDVGCDVAGAGLVAGAPVPGLVADALAPALCGDEEQAAASAATDRSAATALARPTARIDRIMGQSLRGASNNEEPFMLPYGPSQNPGCQPAALSHVWAIWVCDRATSLQPRQLG